MRGARVIASPENAVWIRPGTLLALVGRRDRRARRRPDAPSRARRFRRTLVMRLCLLSSRLVLSASRLLFRAGMLRRRDAASALRLSSRLTAAAMRRWRLGRLDLEA